MIYASTHTGASQRIVASKQIKIKTKQNKMFRPNEVNIEEIEDGRVVLFDFYLNKGRISAEQLVYFVSG